MSEQANEKPQAGAVSVDAVVTCEWRYDEEFDYWHSGCGEDWSFVDGTPKGNGIRFCPFCGDRVQKIGT